MLMKALVAVFWMVALIVLGCVCWVVTVLSGWPLWCMPLMLFAVMLGTWLLLRALRYWQGWRLRQRLQRDLPGRTEPLEPDVDQCWNTGVRLLRQSRLGQTGQLGSALYALPWFMLLGDTTRANSTLLARSGLDTPLRSAPHAAGSPPSDVLNWWFFENAVVLDPSRRLLDSASAWKRLLLRLLRSRRREPLNGVILEIAIESLQDQNKAQLTALGQNLRRQLDDLVKVFGARLPVYLVLTGAERIDGMPQWAASLTQHQRQQALGLLVDGSDADARVFLDKVLGEIGRRLFELRVDLGQRRLPNAQALHFPERDAALRPALEQLLLPAFASNPYCAPPLLSGLFLTAQGVEDDGSTVGWFSHELFDRVLPSQRFAYRAIDGWRHWRRLSAHAAVVLWLVGCGAFAGLLIYSSNHVSHELALIAQTWPPTSTLDKGLEHDLHKFDQYHQFIENLEHEVTPSWKRWLPFHNRVNQLIQFDRDGYVASFDKNLQRPLFMRLLPDQLQAIATSNDDTLIASYTELLVRRINLINARLAGGSLNALPGPGEELLPLLRRFLPDQVPSATRVQSLSGSFKAYLHWQTDERALVEDRANALRQLNGLGLANRSLSWLEAWADQQPQLPTLRYSDYSQLPKDADAALPRAFTVEGRSAILGFIDELIAATGNQALWKNQREHFLVQYQNDTQDAWYRFIEGYLSMDQARMTSQAQWRDALSTVGTARAPYRQLLQRTAERFALIPAANRRPWAQLSVRMNRLFELAQETPAADNGSLLGHLRIANELGGNAIKDVASSGSVTQGVDAVNTDMRQAKVLSQFNQTLQAVATDLRKSDAQAFQVALDNWGFGNDPTIKSAALWDAQDLRDGLRQQLTQGDARESLVWTLAAGGLDVEMAYAGQIAASQLQQAWNSQVLGAVEGVHDPVLLNDALYGERGQLPRFLNGPIKTFIQQDAQGFKPVIALGQKVPLSSAFLAYLGRMQHTQSDLAAATRQTAAQHAVRQAQRQNLQTAEKALQAQQAVLQPQLNLPSLASVVSIQATPLSINLGARQLPQQTRLTLQCSNHSTVLDNFNFPTSAPFTWTPGACGDVSLQVRFAHYTLTKRWPGEHGFIDFLQAFASGQRTLTQDDFPDQRDLMASDNITQLTLTYRYTGAQTLLHTDQQAQAADSQSKAINEQLKTISDQLTAMDTQDAANAVGEAAQGSVAERRLAAQAPPAQIAYGWSGMPSSVASADTKSPPE